MLSTRSYKWEHNISVQNCELKKRNIIKKFPKYHGGLIQAG